MSDDKVIILPSDQKPERRHDYPDLLVAINSVLKNQADLKLEMNEIKQRQSEQLIPTLKQIHAVIYGNGKEGVLETVRVNSQQVSDVCKKLDKAASEQKESIKDFLYGADGRTGAVGELKKDIQIVDQKVDKHIDGHKWWAVLIVGILTFAVPAALEVANWIFHRPLPPH